MRGVGVGLRVFGVLTCKDCGFTMFLCAKGGALDKGFLEKTRDCIRCAEIGISSGGGVWDADATETDRESEEGTESSDFFNGGIEEGWEKTLSNGIFDGCKSLDNMWCDPLQILPLLLKRVGEASICSLRIAMSNFC